VLWLFTPVQLAVPPGRIVVYVTRSQHAGRPAHGVGWADTARRTAHVSTRLTHACARVGHRRGGIHFVSRLWAGRLAHVSDDATRNGSDSTDDSTDDTVDDTVDDTLHALAEARERLAEVPAEVVVLNHTMGLYELAAIHLSSTPPKLAEAALAIDAVACLVEGLGDRLGEEADTMRSALANIQMAFVQVRQTLEP
jgi:hypothetical protein